MRIAIVGGGIFGLTTAWYLAKEGLKVDVFEKEHDVFQAASGINQFRLHRGYHYPRSKETILDCMTGEEKFREYYPEVIIENEKGHYYAVAKEKSFVNADHCSKLFADLHLDYHEENLDILDYNHIEKSFKVTESVIDPEIFKRVCLERCKQHGVNIFLNKEVRYEDLDDYDLIVNTTYASLNHLLKNYPEAQKSYQFELIEKIVLDLPEKYKDISLVIQDGPFTCIDPYGKSGLTLMGNVTKAIHHTNIGTFPDIPEKYRNLLNKGVVKNPEVTNIDLFLEDAEKFLPGIQKDAVHVGSMFTVRTVLPYREHDDARPTVVEKIDDRLVTVFSGKIPTCVDAAQQVLAIVNRKKQRQKKSLNVGIMGVGKWGKNLLRVFDDVANVKTCVHQGSEKTKEYIAEHYPYVKTSTNPESIFTDSAIDAVVIATPIDTHYDLAKRALAAGKKVFLEKPLSDNLDDAQKLFELSQGKHLFIGLIFLYNPCYKIIKELMFNDPIVDIEMNWNKFGSFTEDIFLNIASQELSIVYGLLQKSPVDVKLLKDEGVVSSCDIASIDLTYDNGETCKININRASPQKRKEVRITTRSGNVFYWIDNKVMKLNKETKSLDLIYESVEEPLKTEVKDFINHIEHNQEPLLNKNIAIHNMQTLERIMDLRKEDTATDSMKSVEQQTSFFNTQQTQREAPY